jgi:hypothetical protein
VKTPPRVRFHGLKEFGASESDAGPPKQPGETLNNTICGVLMHCHKCKSRYHHTLKCPEGGRSEKVNYISTMMDMAMISANFLQNALVTSYTTIWITMSLQILKIMLMISNVSISSISIMMTPTMCEMAYALTRDADSQCAAFSSTINAFYQPISSIRTSPTQEIQVREHYRGFAWNSYDMLPNHLWRVTGLRYRCNST